MPIPDPSFQFPVSSIQLNSTSDSAGSANSKHETRNTKRRQRGLTLIELVMFIVIVGAAVAGIIGMIAMSTRSSADPLIHKQALAIAEAMLEEIRLQPFTICDADQITGGVGASGSVTIGTIQSQSFDGSGVNSYVNVSGVNLNGQNAVLVFVGYENANSETISSIVVDPGGQDWTVTALANSNNSRSGFNDARIYLFGRVNPPQGTYTVRVNFNTTLPSASGINVVVYPLSGVDTATPFRSPGTSENDGSSSSVTVPSESGDLAFGGITGETINMPTLTSAGVMDRNIYGGTCSGTDCSNNTATAHQDGAASSVIFSWTHDNDHWAAVGASVKPGSCAEAIGPETISGVTETRYNVPLFDHVNDYHGFDSNTASLTGIRNIDGALIPGLDNYRVTVDVAAQPVGGIGNDADGKPQSLLITVTVTGPGNTTVVVSGYRTRYAPNAVP